MKDMMTYGWRDRLPFAPGAGDGLVANGRGVSARVLDAESSPA